MRQPGLAARCFPAHLAASAIQGDDKGAVPRLLPADFRLFLAAAVIGHDEEILVKDRRGAQAVMAVKFDVPVGPDRLAGDGGGGDASFAEDGVDALAVGGGG